MPLHPVKFGIPGDARKVDPNVDVRARKAVEEGRSISLDKALKGNRGGAFQFALIIYGELLWKF